MRVLAFWAVWLIVGAVGAFIWLQAACPPAACSFVLVFLQAPTFLFSTAAWCIGGVIASIAIASRDWQAPSEGAYYDGQKIQLGDRVRVGADAKTQGIVVYLPASDQAFEGYVPPRLAISKRGFIVATDDGASHHFLAANKHVGLLRRRAAAAAHVGGPVIFT